MRDHPFFCFAFEAIRGICQGGVESCNIWNAIMDILLTAIDLAEVEFLERRGEDHQLRRIHTSAFVDDMLAMVANLRSIRRVADVVCAF